MNIFNRDKFPTKLFVTASLLCLFLMLSIFIVLTYNSNQEVNARNHKARYFLNDNYNQTDPYITNIPNLEDIIRGPIICDIDPIIGSVDSKVVLVNFSDYECNFCKKQEEILRKVLLDYNGEVSLIWKDYPKNDTDSISWLASIAGRCAQAQNKFWEYHDLLYSNNDNLSYNKFIQIAQNLGLDIAGFEDCLNDPMTANLVIDNIKEANALDINGIPFIYVNDQEVMGEIDEGDLKRLIDIELEG